MSDNTPTASRSTPPSGPLSGHYPPGHRLHHFTVRQMLGEGGFGVVYQAEQIEPVRRMVALKVIKPGMDSHAVIARFEAERQALALMDHPCVAKVYDGGLTPEGRPYFAMEYIKGLPITEHCDRHRLSLNQRLELFIRVCEAVQHAHTKGVVHRDLKPSNILVEYEDSKSTPKIIDFGVAKALNQRLTEATIFTEQGHLIGTPEYMSPEQAEMSGQDIDTRSDIYSLGVVLYELLTGSRPFEPDTLRQAGLAEIQRIIREIEPQKPSTRLSSLASRPGDPSNATRVAQSRRTELRSLQGILRRDLDWVAMKCLEKDRERRYDTANALAMELRRYLENEPVLAGPPSLSYRAGKFIKRNRTGVTAAVFTAAALLVATVVSVAFGIMATRERDRAEQLLSERDTALARESEQRAAAWDALSTARLGIALSQEISDDTRSALSDTVSLRERLGQPLHGEAVLAEWLLAELSRDVGHYDVALSLFDSVLSRLTLAQQAGLETLLVHQANSVLPGIEDAGTIHDIFEQVSRGRIVAFGMSGDWQSAVDAAVDLLRHISAVNDREFSEMHATRDLALILARFEQHEAALQLWDEFESKYEQVGSGLGGNLGIFERFSMNATRWSNDLYHLHLDLYNSMIETGRYEEAEKWLLTFESAWRADKNDIMPAAVTRLIARNFRLLTSVVYRRDPTHTQWNSPLDLLVKLYERWNRPEQAEMWRTRQIILQTDGRPPIRWPIPADQ